MIAEYESENRGKKYDAPRLYGLTQNHKHLKEMKIVSGLEYAPVFCPIVDDFYSGMETIIPLFADEINGTAEDIKKVYKEVYQSKMIWCGKEDADGMMAANSMSLRDDMTISVQGNEERILLTARFDNLGKGASGAAIQNMNIIMGIDETTGLITEDL